MSALRMENIIKRYTNHVAVDNVSFDVPEASLFGLLGPNGAGKTTLIRILTQIIHPDEGEVHFFDEPLHADHISHIGYLPEERGLYGKMGVEEHIAYLAQLKGLSYREVINKMDKWLDKFNLSAWRKNNVNELSKGMQQKVQLISTLIHEPELVILDEPFSGLDPVNVNLIREEMRKLRKKGVTVILSTHRMERVEEICDTILLINEGKKILEGEMDTVKQQHKKNEFRLVYKGELPPDTNPAKFDIIQQNKQGCRVKLNEKGTPNDILSFFIGASVQVQEFYEILPSLDEVFLQHVEE